MNTLGLVAAILMVLATIFFLVGVARGWFKDDVPGGNIQLGTTGLCGFGSGSSACDSYDCGSNDDCKRNGGGVAIAFTVFAFLVGIVAIIWNFCTALGKGPGILQNGMIAAVLNGVCFVCSLIAWAAFVGCVKNSDSFDQFDPHYSWVLVLIGSIFSIAAAVLIFLGKGGATAK